MSKPEKIEFTRRDFIKTTLAGVGGIAAWSIIGNCNGGSYLRGDRGPAVHSIPLNTDWRFGEAVEGSNRIQFDESTFKKITLPHTVTELSWREWDPETWENVWSYRRTIDPDQDLTNKRVFIDFGAAMTAATVILNEQKIGAHTGGYLPFSVELTEQIREGYNLLAVELDSRFSVNTPPNRPGHKTTVIDFWQPGGLYRTVNLRIVPKLFVADVFAKPVDVLDNPKLEIECTIDAAIVPENSLKIEVELLDGDNRISSASIPVNVEEAGQKTVKLTLEGLHNIHLWDIDDPHLYEAIVTLSVDDTSIHDYAVKTGFREAKFKQDGFYLNGRRVQLFGLNRHHIYPFAGGAMPARIQRKDAEILKKELNCNMVRCSHYPQSDAFFDACDELGLMAFEEVAGWGMWLGDSEWKQRVVNDVEKMVQKHRNHPSIVIWGTRMNETPDDIELNRRTKDKAGVLDDSRQTTGSIGGWDHNTKNFVQDVFSLNDYSSTKDENGVQWPELHPPREDFPYLVSEAVGTLSGPAKYYRRNVPTIFQQGQARAHARVHNIANSDKGYCGLLAWSGFDYPSGNGNQFDGVKYTGVVDLFRVPKLGAAIYRAQIEPEIRPVIAPAFYWDFGSDSLHFEHDQKAMICSNCDRLELYIDDRHYATVYPDTNRFDHLAYPPSFVNLNGVDGSGKPELRIEGYVREEQVISKSFSSDLSGDRLLLIADDIELRADGSDATRVVFRAVDKYGAPRPYPTGEVKLQLDGPAKLIGDNPFAFEETGGVGAVWVRTVPDQTGQLRLNAEHPYLGSEMVKIESV